MTNTLTTPRDEHMLTFRTWFVIVEEAEVRAYDNEEAARHVARELASRNPAHRVYVAASLACYFMPQDIAVVEHLS